MTDREITELLAGVMGWEKATGWRGWYDKANDIAHHESQWDPLHSLADAMALWVKFSEGRETKLTYRNGSWSADAKVDGVRWWVYADNPDLCRAICQCVCKAVQGGGE